jgi:hypothetical protein
VKPEIVSFVLTVRVEFRHRGKTSEVCLVKRLNGNDGGAASA